MAHEVILPKQGQSVETCLILNWKKKVGDPVQEGEVLVEVETDKAAFEVTAPAGGILLKIFHQEGEDVPVLSALAMIGQAGEELAEPQPQGPKSQEQAKAVGATQAAAAQARAAQAQAIAGPALAAGKSMIPISPRAWRLAEKLGLSPEEVAAAVPQGKGSGPGGRLLEQDVQRVLAARGASPGIEARPRAVAAEAAAAPAGKPAAEKRPAAEAAATAPGRPAAPGAVFLAAAEFPGPVTELPVKGVRKIIAERMLASLQTTAQYTLNASANAEILVAYRQKLKESPEELGLVSITISDMINFVAAQVLARHAELNCHFIEGKILQFQRVHLAFAVDTPRGLIVPVIRNAGYMTLRQIALEAARLRQACLEGTVTLDLLAGGTFTVTNLGVLGVESFTPVINPPQVAILGVGGIQLKPVQGENEVSFKPHIGLSLTANHQVVDGAPAARFLQQLCQAIESFGLLLAG